MGVAHHVVGPDDVGPVELVEEPPCLRADEPVDLAAVAPLERPHRGVGGALEVAVDHEQRVGAVLVEPNLQLFDDRALVAPAQQRRSRGRWRQVAGGRSAQRIVDQRARSGQGRHRIALTLPLHPQELDDVAVADETLQLQDPLGDGVDVVDVDRARVRRCTPVVAARTLTRDPFGHGNIVADHGDPTGVPRVPVRATTGARTGDRYQVECRRREHRENERGSPRSPVAVVAEPG